MNPTLSAATSWSLPLPEAEALARSARLTEHLRSVIAAAGGSISFEHYMELALYAPGLGYYTASPAFGEDFVTAPELGPLFARCLARQVAEVLATSGGSLLEIGPGSGALAAELLRQLQALGRLPKACLLVEISPALRQRQRQRLAMAPCPVHWLDHLPAGFRGVVVANELLDAFPVQRYLWQGDALIELGVGLDTVGALCWRPKENPQAQVLATALAPWLRECPAGYCFEWHARAQDWITALSDSLRQGLALIVDYGYSRRDYFHPQRRGGTLLCHFRHRVHDDPLLWPGLTDMTASLDFTALAQAARRSGLTVHGYASQAGFLLGCGLEAVLQDMPRQPLAAWLRTSREAQLLTSPGGMGERFKVLALGRGLSQPLCGFTWQDWRERL